MDSRDGIHEQSLEDDDVESRHDQKPQHSRRPGNRAEGTAADLWACLVSFPDTAANTAPLSPTAIAPASSGTRTPRERFQARKQNRRDGATQRHGHLPDAERPAATRRGIHPKQCAGSGNRNDRRADPGHQAVPRREGASNLQSSRRRGRPSRGLCRGASFASTPTRSTATPAAEQREAQAEEGRGQDRPTRRGSTRMRVEARARSRAAQTPRTRPRPEQPPALARTMPGGIKSVRRHRSTILAAWIATLMYVPRAAAKLGMRWSSSATGRRCWRWSSRTRWPESTGSASGGG